MGRDRIRKYWCNHEPYCSQPGQYWRFFNGVELLDANCNQTEVLVPELKKSVDQDHAACCECGKSAQAYWSDIMQKAEKGKQEVLL